MKTLPKLFCVASLIKCTLVFAQPDLATSSTNTSENEEITVTITGSGFGEKDVAPPVLIDRAEIALESGAEDTTHSLMQEGDEIYDTQDYSSAVWTKVRRLFLTQSRPARHRHSSEHYYFKGPNERIGNPSIYGGVTGWETPPNNHQLYVSWWFKPKYNPSNYWKFLSADITGSFIEGEVIKFSSGRTAQFIGKDTSGALNIVFDGDNPSSDSISGNTVTGVESGASATFPSSNFGSNEYGYENPGSQKFIRVWEHPDGKEGIRFSWTQMHQTIFRTDGSSISNWDSQALEGGKWHHLELAMDDAKGRVDLYVNSKHMTGFNFPTDIQIDGASPTIALIGLNGKVGSLQEGDIDDIYMDATLQRVLLGNAPSINDVTHWEVQEPVEWSNEAITFKVFEGALQDFSSSYIYVFDKNGAANANGLKVCLECIAPPEKVEVKLVE